MAFVPKIDQQLIVDLPGEKLPATVRKVLNQNMAIVELTNQPLAKAHTYRLRELVPVRRTAGMLGETWQAVSQAELRLAQEKEAAKKKAPVKKTKGKRRAAASR